MFISRHCHDADALKRQTAKVLLTASWFYVRAQAIWLEHAVFLFGTYANDITADGADSKCDPGSSI